MGNLGQPSDTINATIVAMVEQAAMNRIYVVRAVGTLCAIVGILSAGLAVVSTAELWVKGAPLTLEDVARIGRPLFLFYCGAALVPSRPHYWLAWSSASPPLKAMLLGWVLMANADLPLLWQITWLPLWPNIILAIALALWFYAGILASRRRAHQQAG